jgi:chemotaxis signal transduction protein
MKTDNAEALPSLETLINSIDQQVNRVHGLTAAEGFAAFLGGRPEDYQQTGEKYVRFVVDDTTFAIPMKNTMEIHSIPEITPLPNLPDWLLGICNLRGDIVSVVDLQKLCKVTSSNVTGIKKLILIRKKGVRTAIVVDAVAGIRVYHQQEGEGHEKQIRSGDNPFSRLIKRTTVLGRRTVQLLDLTALMAAIKI